MRRLLWPSILIIVAGIVIAIWLTIANQPEDTLTRAQRLGVIRVGYAPESPFAFRSMGGAVTGESPEIIRLMLANLGINKIEWVQTDWASLIPNLNAGRFDIIAAGMFITCERAQLIDFTRPTYQMNEALLVRKGNPKNLHSYRDFVGTSAVLAVVNGAQEQHIASMLGVADANIVAVPDAQTGLAVVQAGRADALALTSVSLRMFAKQHDTVEVAQPFDPPMIQGDPVLGYGAFGIRKNDTRLRQALDSQLATFLGSQEHSALVEPFGFTKSELPHSDSSDILASCGAHAIPSDPSP